MIQFVVSRKGVVDGQGSLEEGVSYRAVWGNKCRGPDPAAGADILNADVRRYRNGTAAASNKNGRGVDHGRGYKAGRALRQEI